MKVLFKYSNKTETIENVIVDDKCLPVIAGLHPYSVSTTDMSPLTHQSALWFKTLAVDVIYIDCDRRLIHWVPIKNDVDPSGVVLRKSVTSDPFGSFSEFIPSMARPLFEDSTLYDFDANLKEMMGKCCEAARKFFKRFIAIDQFNKIVARLLHVYILPSIIFTPEDMYCLTRTRFLIEERLTKAEQDIREKADGIDQLKTCHATLKANLLSNENLENERYLRTCKRDFLEVFLKNIEEDVENMNFELEAEQRKVNWAKQHPEDAAQLEVLQCRRDELFQRVIKLIRVREAFKNVVKRKELTKKKIKKSQIIQNCFHNIFVEINRRLDVENQALSRLGNDKVSICAAREATICAILEMDSNNRNSDRATKFEPEDFVDYSHSENNKSEKRLWLTFQERVSKVLEDPSSSGHKLHKDGCERLEAFIRLALSEFQLAQTGNKRFIKRREIFSSGGSSSQFDIPTRNFHSLLEGTAKNLVLDTEDNHLDSDPDTQPAMISQESTSDLASHKKLSKDGRSLSVSQILFNGASKEEENINVDELWFRRNSLEVFVNHFGDSNSLNGAEDTVCEDFVLLRKPQLHTQKHVMTQQLALSALMKSVEDLKSSVQTHFRDVIEGLVQQLDPEDPDDSPVIEEQELLWKSYERSFCKVLLPQLLLIYTTGLSPGPQKAHAHLTETPLEEILKDDKLLDLFFGPGALNNQSNSIPVPSGPSHLVHKISVAKTASTLSIDVRHCDINYLYGLANADSNDLRMHFDMDDIEDWNETDKERRESSSGSSESADFSCDEGALDLSSLSSSANTPSAESNPSTEKNLKTMDFDLDENLSGHKSRTSSESSDTAQERITYLGPDKIEQILEPILSVFRKQIRKCLDAECFLDKVRYISKAIEGLNKTISQMLGPNFQSACDDIISMIILALCNMPEDVFVNLYVNLRLLMDVLPHFLRGTLWDYNLVSLYASYDYLFTLKVCEHVIRCYPGSFKVKTGH